MRGRNPGSVHVWRLLPLIAVVGLLAPATAAGANPAPDQPPTGTGLAPDAAPVTHSTRRPLAVTPLIVAPSRTVAPPARVAAPPTARPKRRRVAPLHHAARAVAIVDVVPSLVDLHPELGALPVLPRDDSTLVLAAAALLACAFVIVPTAGADGVSYTIISGTLGDNGWYRSPVRVQINASAPTTCPTVADFTTSNSAVDCTWGSQDTAFHLQFKIDTDAPSVTGASADRAPDGADWYTHPVTFAFSGTDPNSGIASCTSATYSGPDATAGAATGTCRDKAGNVSGTASLAVKYDATPPTVTPTPGRKPTATGWYNHPVSIAFAATDATSGVGSCSAPLRYAGPDTTAGTITGTCTDQAGNKASATLPFKYDSTAPRVSDVAAAAVGHSVTVKWRATGGLNATVLRAPGRGRAKVSVVYHGPGSSYRDATIKKGVVYHYTVATTDAAGNDARAKVSTSLRLLMAPAAGAVVRAGDALSWQKSPGASYYNVQLFRGGKKVLTAWPVTARFRLPRAWTFAGRHEKLARGTYTWYVWPGHGGRAAARYGRLLGGSSFRVR